MSSNYHFSKPLYKQLRRLNILKKKLNKRVSDTKSRYHENLEDKQKLRFYYGINEKHLKKYISISRHSKNPTSKTLSKLLLMRLDHVILKLGICHTIFEARQYIQHKNVLVNKNLVNLSNYCCKLNDEITFLLTNKLQEIIISKTKLEENNKWISLPINYLTVIEYYSNIK
uniref:ribosomal protein S4 n=1 Tax=Hydnora abyssinica TaxID=470280 RepID=UPI0021158FA6|nr:ribosomal protein S4 [Hydnora abyssinica]USN93586.1 ribosomal protein S4 [Hydnora abyssinica]